ncbi:MAG: GNAT family protein [Chloroflexota bacterium]
MDGGGHPWALFDLRIWTERLELRLPTEDELVGLMELAASGIHDPNEMPFGFAWTDQPSPLFERSFFQYHWSTRATFAVDNWNLDLGVWSEGRLVGTQGIGAKQFAVIRTVSTGSWLAREFQGRGIGKEMRSAVLSFAFDHLGAYWATSGAFADNPASGKVSRSLGYEEDGIDVLAPRGEPRESIRYRINADQWRARERPHIEVAGLERCYDMFGAD